MALDTRVPAAILPRMRYTLAALILALSLVATHAQQRIGGVDGTWLVAMLLKDEEGGHGAKASDMPYLAARQCGINTEVLSGRSFEGIDPSLTLVGVGPYASDFSAKENLRQIRKCVPAAYLRRLVFYRN